MSVESDNVLREELALQMWNGISDVHKKADVMLPWLRGKLADAYTRGYREALARVRMDIASLERQGALSGVRSGETMARVASPVERGTVQG